MTCILNIVNSASLISCDHVAMKILVLNSSLYGWPLWCLPPSYRDWNICMFEVNKIIISFQITETYPKIWKKIYQWHIISKSPKYTQTESQKYHPSIRNITDPALNWAWHPGPSGGLQADAAHANRTLWRRRKRKIQKGQGKMTYTWWAPERAKLVTIAWWTVGFMRFIANGI
jgi:hypothetical protein